MGALRLCPAPVGLVLFYGVLAQTRFNGLNSSLLSAPRAIPNSSGGTPGTLACARLRVVTMEPR